MISAAEGPFLAAAELVESFVRDGRDSGCMAAAYLNGHLVLDVSAGLPEGALVQVWSAGKPVCALALLVLVARGRLSLDDPVVRHWPEFGANGKAGTTVRQLLTHEAGLVWLDPLPREAWFDSAALASALASAAPNWEPGTAFGEQAAFYGNLVGEVVRRVDGRTLGRVIAEDIAAPLGIDLHLGPPDAATLARIVDLEDPGGRWAAAPLGDGSVPDPLGNPPGARDLALLNSERWRRAEVGALNLHSDARSLARLYAAVLAGEAPWTPDLLAAATRPQVTGRDRVIGDERSYGLGPIVDETGFGHGGTGGSCGWADPARGLAWSFVTRTMAGYDRLEELEAALLAAVDSLSR